MAINHDFGHNLAKSWYFLKTFIPFETVFFYLSNDTKMIQKEQFPGELERKQRHGLVDELGSFPLCFRPISPKGEVHLLDSFCPGSVGNWALPGIWQHGTQSFAAANRFVMPLVLRRSSKKSPEFSTCFFSLKCKKCGHLWADKWHTPHKAFGAEKWSDKMWMDGGICINLQGAVWIWRSRGIWRGH